jgi:hypothetical protein
MDSSPSLPNSRKFAGILSSVRRELSVCWDRCRISQEERLNCAPYSLLAQVNETIDLGIRFMLNKVVTCGVGCILAHTMGTGKSFQICAMADVFLRIPPTRQSSLLSQSTPFSTGGQSLIAGYHLFLMNPLLLDDSFLSMWFHQIWKFMQESM